MKEIENRFNTKWGPTLFKNWMVFIPAPAANFSLVPVQMRALVISGLSLILIGNADYCSYRRHRFFVLE